MTDERQAGLGGDTLYPHRGGWRHASWCQWERGSETYCDCGLDNLRAALAAQVPAQEERLDELRLRRAIERGLAAVDDEWTIEELAELSADEYAALGETS